MTEQNPQNQAGANPDQAASVQFAIQRVYVKDLSFEAPQGAKAFQKQWTPQVNQDLNTKVEKLDEQNYEVVLKLTVTVSDKEEGETIYLVEVQQAGIFAVSGVEGIQLAHLLNAQCAQILFPYARELVDSCVTRGSFPPLMLPPINFDALFQQAVERAQQQNGNGEQQAAAEGMSLN